MAEALLQELCSMLDTYTGRDKVNEQCLISKLYTENLDSKIIHEEFSFRIFFFHLAFNIIEAEKLDYCLSDSKLFPGYLPT